MIQQVNLYHSRFRREKPKFHAQIMLLALGGLLALLVLLTIWAKMDLAGEQAKLSALSQQQQKIQAELDALKIKLSSVQFNQLLESKKDNLTQELRDARLLANLLASEIERPVYPYSSYFRALAESVVSGLWVESLAVSQSGRQIKITGYSQLPESVPLLLQALKSNDVFKGKTFEKVEMSRKQSDDENIFFEMQALRQETPGN